MEDRFNHEKARLAEEFRQAGHSAIEAETYVALHAAQAQAFANQYGLDPAELLSIRRIERAPGAPQTLTSYAVSSADETLWRDSEAWANRVDAFIEGTLPARQSVVMLNQTPLALQMLGAKNLPVRTTYGALKKVLVDKHKLPQETLKQVPAAMADPVMVFKSATQGGDMVMMLELKNQHGATVIVPIALEQSTPEGYTVNLATSVYGRQYGGTTEPNNQWFLDQILDGNLLYQNKKKSRTWAAMVGLSLPPTHRSSSVKNNIYTDADLVKLRKTNPTMYQSAFHGSPYRFVRFSLGHIGNGEGFQSYGWGLYFAGDKAVAEHYRERLSHRDMPNLIFPDGEHMRPGDPDFKTKISILMHETGIHERYDFGAPEYYALHDAFTGAASLDAVERTLDLHSEMHEKKGLKDQAIADTRAGNAMRELRRKGLLKEADRGQLYEVNIPENHELLDWETPLTEQPGQIRDALKMAGVIDGFNAEWKKQLGSEEAANQYWGASGPKHKHLYNYLEYRFGSGHAASKYLNSIGIKGIRYLDGASRDKGKGSYNYVIFDDAAIEIIQTYYQYAGERSNMSAAVRANLAKAQRLAEAGTDNEIIRQETGWFKSMDDKWRYEIPDNIEKMAMPGGKGWLSLGDIYDNPDLYTAYPHLKDIEVAFDADGLPEGVSGRYTKPHSLPGGAVTHERIQICPYRDEDKQRKSLLHEIQHAIQEAEGFARGGSPKEFGKQYAISESARVSAKEISPEEQYYSLAGEIEARDTAKRGLFGKPARKRVKPDLRDDAVVLFGGERVASFSSELTKRGAVSFDSTGASITHLFNASDLSTPIHEASHIFLNDLLRVSAQAETSSNHGLAREDVATLVDNANAQRESFTAATGMDTEHVPVDAALRNELTPGQARTLHEVTAASFETYILTEEAPKPALQGVFSRMKAWLGDVYRATKEICGVTAPESVTQVFDRMLASDSDMLTSNSQGDDDEDYSPSLS
jgi:hypothetical protein